MHFDIDALARQVQYNCHVSDARHGADQGLCTYLMRMREYYRWEHGLPWTATLDKDAVGDWLSEREAHWETLADADYRPLRLGEHRIDPFDVEAVNLRINGFGYVYSAGLAHAGRAQFFLGRLLEEERGEDGFVLRLAGRELARGLHVPPAMLREGCICLRRDALKQLLWEKYESWRWNRPDNALGRALACYGFERDPEAALERMTERELRVVRDHEIGEYRAGRLLGDDWEALLLRVLGTPAERMLRAVRDHLADALVTLPRLLDAPEDEAALHAYVGNLGAMRRELFPALKAAYEIWCERGDIAPLRDCVARGAEHWLVVARRALDLHRAHPRGAVAGPVAELLGAARL